MSRDEAYLLDILEAARLTLAYAQEINQESLEADQMRLDAIIRRPEIIGEATRRISETFRNKHPEIPWREMAGMRNQLIHNYDEVDLDIVWDVIEHHVPRLIAKIEPLVPPDTEGS